MIATMESTSSSGMEMSDAKLEFTGSGGKRMVEIDGVSYMMPRNVDVFQGNKGLRMQAHIGYCEVNGVRLTKRVALQHVRKETNKETILALRALREELMPLSGEKHTEVHQIVGSLILRAFDLEQPGSRILDEDTVTVGCKRHVYPRKTSYLAGDLRQLDPTAELCRMAATHMADPAVIKGALDRTPTPSPASAGETAAIVRGMLNAGVMTPKKRRVKPEGRRAVRGEDGVSWALPWGVYLVDPRRGEPSDRLKLRMLVRLSSGSCQVNGKAIGGAVSVRLERDEISKRTVLALRELRDELFPMEEPARHHVHRAVAALILRAFDRENPGSNVEDETVVTIRTERHGYVKETPFIAGDLRAANLNELAFMTERFFSDPLVMSGTLEAGRALGPDECRPDLAPPPREKKKTKEIKAAVAAAAAASSAAKVANISGATVVGNKVTNLSGARVVGRKVTNLSAASVVGNKRGRSKTEDNRVADGGGGNVLRLPWGMHLDSEDAVGETTMRLKMKLGVVSVNGEECMSAQKIKIVGGVAVNAPNLAALRSLRDDFALGLGASEAVRTIVAAKAFRLWLRSRQASEILDEESVRFSPVAEMAGVSIGRDYVVLTAGVLRKAYRERSTVIDELLSAAVRGSSASLECGLESPPAGGVVEERGEGEGAEGCAAFVEDAGADSAASAKRMKPVRRKKAGGSPTESGGPTRSTTKASGKASGKERGSRKRRKDDTSAGKEGVEGGSPAQRVDAVETQSAPDSSAKQTKKKSKKKRRDGEPAHTAAGETTQSATPAAKKTKEKGTAGKRSSKKKAKRATRQEEVEQDESVAAKLSEPVNLVQAQAQVVPADSSKKKKRKKDRKTGGRKTHDEEPRCPVEAEEHRRTGQGVTCVVAESSRAEQPLLSQARERQTSPVEKSKQPFKSRKLRLMDWIANA